MIKRKINAKETAEIILRYWPEDERVRAMTNDQ